MGISHKSSNDPALYASLPLLPGEKIISVIEHPVRKHPENPSTTEQLLRLTRSNHVDDIGHAGPALASLSMPSSTNEAEDGDHLHLFEAVFGRDSLRVARDLLHSYPKLAHSTLVALAGLQGTTYNIDREEEPGRIVHEARSPDDPFAKALTAERGWHWPYYASVDATPEFIRTLCEYTLASPKNHAFLEETFVDRMGNSRTMLDSLDSALGWITRRMQQNPQGLLEYQSVLPRGIENQVWRDSWDAYHHSDGTIANHHQGIASTEVQVSAYEALLDAATLFEDITDNTVRAASLRAQANDLRDAIFTHFWTEEKGGYFVLGTDRDDKGNLRQLKIRTSNMGHVLNSRLLDGHDADIVRMRDSIVRNLLTPEMRGAGGIRTLASDEIRFRPGAYHNGSIWLWDTHYIAEGMRRYGYEEDADDLDNTLVEIANSTGLFPEYIRGEQDRIALNQKTIVLWDEKAGRENVVEQPPQEVQAWTVAAIRNTKMRNAQRHTQTVKSH